MLLNILKYSLKNILRNKFLTISTILVLTLLIFFINVLHILDTVSLKIISEINSKMSISLYLKDGLTEDSLEVSTLKSNIKSVNENIKFDYKTKEQNMKEMGQREPEAAKILENEENPLPNTIVLSEIDIKDYKFVNNEIEKQISIFINNEVDKNYFANYKTQYDRIIQVINILNTLKIGLEIVIVTFFVSIAIITYSVIGNFVYYYKNEIYITRLVGGARSFIYGPFILQGIFYSMFSFLISFITFIFLIKNLNNVFGEYFTYKISLQVILIQIFLFIIIGGFSGYFSSKKYLSIE